MIKTLWPSTYVIVLTALASCRASPEYDPNYSVFVAFGTTLKRQVDQIVVYYDRDDHTEGMDLDRLPRLVTLSSKGAIDDFVYALRERETIPQVRSRKSMPTLYIVAHDNAHGISGFIRYAITCGDDMTVGLVIPNGGGSVRKNRALLDWLKATKPAIYRDCVVRASAPVP